MITITIELAVLADKRKEFVQAMMGLTPLIRLEKGCISHHFCQDMEDENRFFVLEAWERKIDLDAHWRSKHFRAFMGSAYLMRHEPDFKVNRVASTAGNEAILFKDFSDDSYSSSILVYK